MNGFFNINKPSGISSAKVVSTIKHKFGIKDKIGHMGTLDPLASGVLVVGVGRANRLFDKMKEKHKVYDAVFEFGYQTISLDTEREELAFSGGPIPSKEQIEEVLPSFVGKQQQTAPIFSAKNVSGKRAYEIARDGGFIEIKPHMIEIYNITLLRQIDATKIEFKIDCSGGTYIRSIARDLAKKLGTFATMLNLKRTQSGQFKIENSVSLDDVVESDLQKIDIALNDMPRLNFDKKTVDTIKNGLKADVAFEDGEYCCMLEGNVVGICVVEKGKATMKTWLL